MKYCPRCGAEYLEGFTSCSDCGVGLVDSPPEPQEADEAPPPVTEPVTVFRTGRRLDAELVRGRLEADGIQTWIWSGGMGPWRVESALTEITGVPNDFNSHQVVVAAEDEDRAREVLDEPMAISDGDEIDPKADPFARPSVGVMQRLRTDWVLKGFAIVTLAVMLWTLFD